MFNGLGNGEFLEQEEKYLQAEAERAAIEAAKSDEQREAEAATKLALDQYIRQLNVNTIIFNKANPATLPLTAFEEQFRQATVAGDFMAMNKLMPFSIYRWNAATPLGKYRFNVINGQKQYVAFSDADITRFLAGPWMTPNIYGRASMIEPNADCDINHIFDLYAAGQKGTREAYPVTAWQHVFPIYPGLYICQIYKGSTWVRWRGAVWTAVAIVAAVYLGPIILDKVATGATSGSAATSGAAVTAETTTGIVGAGTKATAAVITKAGAGAAITTTSATTAVVATAAETATFFQTVQSGANTLLEYVNQARTVEAIAKGEAPPPPISIFGDTFTDWAMIVVKEQIAKEAQERAIELGTEYIQRKMTEKEEARLRAEIQAMQAELAALMPAGISATPNAGVPGEVQAKSAELALKEKQAQDLMLAALAIATGFIFLS